VTWKRQVEATRARLLSRLNQLKATFSSDGVPEIIVFLYSLDLIASGSYVRHQTAGELEAALGLSAAAAPAA
jgi:hypothetical protein